MVLKKKKTGQRRLFRHFWKILTKKNAFFLGAPPKISIDWRQRHLQKIFKVSQPKMDISKIVQRGALCAAGGRIPKSATDH